MLERVGGQGGGGLAGGAYEIAVGDTAGLLAHLPGLLAEQPGQARRVGQAACREERAQPVAVDVADGEPVVGPGEFGQAGGGGADRHDDELADGLGEGGGGGGGADDGGEQFAAGCPQPLRAGGELCGEAGADQGGHRHVGRRGVGRGGVDQDGGIGQDGSVVQEGRVERAGPDGTGDLRVGPGLDDDEGDLYGEPAGTEEVGLPLDPDAGRGADARERVGGRDEGLGQWRVLRDQYRGVAADRRAGRAQPGAVDGVEEGRAEAGGGDGEQQGERRQNGGAVATAGVAGAAGEAEEGDRAAAAPGEGGEPADDGRLDPGEQQTAAECDQQRGGDQQWVRPARRRGGAPAADLGDGRAGDGEDEEFADRPAPPGRPGTVGRAAGARGAGEQGGGADREGQDGEQCRGHCGEDGGGPAGGGQQDEREGGGSPGCRQDGHRALAEQAQQDPGA